MTMTAMKFVRSSPHLARRGQASRVAFAAAFCVSWLSSATVALSEPTAAASVSTARGPETREPDLEKARNHFLQGVQFYNNGDYKLSLIEFRRSHELSQNSRILYNIGQVNQQLGNYTNALAALEQYLREAGSEVADERRAEVTATLAQLRRRVSHFRLLVNVSAPEIFVDGFPVQPAGGSATVTVDPGDHRIEVRKPGFQSAGTILSLAAGETSEVHLELARTQSPLVVAPLPNARAAQPKKDATWLWVGWSTTGAVALGAGITGILANMQASELAELRNSPSSTQDQRDEVGRRAKSFALASDVLTGAALAVGAASLYLTLRSSSDGAIERAPAATTRVALRPTGVNVIQSF
jgi:tetratricopeptide (TPR) repeat protein